MVGLYNTNNPFTYKRICAIKRRNDNCMATTCHNCNIIFLVYNRLPTIYPSSPKNEFLSPAKYQMLVCSPHWLKPERFEIYS